MDGTPPPSQQECDQANMNRWNELVGHHMNSEYYQLNDFKSGALHSSLCPTILEDLGPHFDVKGKTILHLQCHFGQDTLSWLRLGASSVVGIDYSQAGVAAATRLAAELGYSDRAEFICSNVMTLTECKQLENRTFDMVITNEGAINWLQDLRTWSRVIKHYMKPAGGIFYIFEFHPFASVFDDDEDEAKAEGEDPRLHFTYPYFEGRVLELDAPETYTEEPVQLKNRQEYGWGHSISEILNVLLAENLQLKFMHEFAFSTYAQLPGIKVVGEGNERRYEFLDKKKREAIPLMFSILASL